MWYYLCKNTKAVNGKSCGFSKHYRQEDVNEQVRVVIQEALRNIDFTQGIKKVIGTNDNLDTLKAEFNSLEEAKKKEERQKTKLLGKIMALDADDNLYDNMYDELQGLLRERIKNISDLDMRINQVSIAIQNANSRKLTAEDVYAAIHIVADMMGALPPEYEQKIAHALLESVQLYPERQPNGLLVKSVRFKVPLNYNGVRWQDVILETDEEDGDFLPNESNVEKMNERVKTKNRFLCITKPRRFGKTSVLNMLGAYYGKTYPSEDLFTGLNISGSQSYLVHLNQYNLISLSMNDLPGMKNTYLDYIGQFEKSLRNDIREAYPELNEKEFNSLSCVVTLAYLSARDCHRIKGRQYAGGGYQADERERI